LGVHPEKTSRISALFSVELAPGSLLEQPRMDKTAMLNRIGKNL
jgi:hypothetical protein